MKKMMPTYSDGPLDIPILRNPRFSESVSVASAREISCRFFTSLVIPEKISYTWNKLSCMHGCLTLVDRTCVHGTVP